MSTKNPIKPNFCRIKSQKIIIFVQFHQTKSLDKNPFLPYYRTKGVYEMKKTVISDLGNKEIFARNLNRYLSLSGKTQKEVAEAVKISTSTFSDWTKGRIYPRMDKVQALADYFGIQKSDLVEAVNIPTESVNDEDQKVLDMFHKVPKEKREFLLSLIQATIDNL